MSRIPSPGGGRKKKPVKPELLADLEEIHKAHARSACQDDPVSTDIITLFAKKSRHHRLSKNQKQKLPPRLPLHAFFQLVRLFEQLARARVQALPRRSEREVRPVPLAERLAQLPLQRRDGARDGGVALVQPPRGGGKTARLAQRGKDPKLFEFLQKLKVCGSSSESM